MAIFTLQNSAVHCDSKSHIWLLKLKLKLKCQPLRRTGNIANAQQPCAATSTVLDNADTEHFYHCRKFQCTTSLQKDSHKKHQVLSLFSCSLFNCIEILQDISLSGNWGIKIAGSTLLLKMLSNLSSSNALLSSFSTGQYGRPVIPPSSSYPRYILFFK